LGGIISISNTDVRSALLVVLVGLALLVLGCTSGDAGEPPNPGRDGSQTEVPADDDREGSDDPSPNNGGGSGDDASDGGDAADDSGESEEDEPEPLPDLTLGWSMAARYGLDRNDDGFTDYGCNGGDGEAKFTSPSKRDGGAGCYEVDPGTFAVALDACANAAVTPDATFRWTVAGLEMEATGCELTVELPEGSQQISVSASANGELVAGPTTHVIEVDDVLIVVVGDSWTVGTGAPDIPGDGDAYATWAGAVQAWLDAQQALARAEAEAAAAARALRDATVLFDEADAAAGDALDECFVRRFGRRVIRISGLGDCFDALRELGVSFIEDITKLDSRIEDSVDDARRARDRAQSAQRSAREAAARAADALEGANEARKLAATESAGQYQHEGCARSANAGPAQMARIIEEADARTSVTLVHLSCSGADVTGLIGGGKADQLNLAAKATGERTVDLLLVGVGGNDLELNTILGDLCPRQAECQSPAPPSNVDGTIRSYCTAASSLDTLGALLADSDIGGACVDLYAEKLQQLKDAGIVADAPIDTSARAWFEQLLAGTAPANLCDDDPDPENLRDAGLALRYDCLAGEIEKRFGARVAPQRVVVWEYIDVAHTSDGSLCPPGIPDGSGNESARSLPGFSAAEIAFLDEVFETINGEIRSAAGRHGWTFLATNAGSRRHGLCANENWIARFDQWLFNAPGASSLAHPTIDGMTYLGQTLAEGIRPLLATPAP
jgi:hypothetical protein